MNEEDMKELINAEQIAIRELGMEVSNLKERIIHLENHIKYLHSMMEF